MPLALLADRWRLSSLAYVWPVVEAHPELFEPMHTIGTATLFRVAAERWSPHLRVRPEAGGASAPVGSADRSQVGGWPAANQPAGTPP